MVPVHVDPIDHHLVSNVQYRRKREGAPGDYLGIGRAPNMSIDSAETEMVGDRDGAEHRVKGTTKEGLGQMGVHDAWSAS